MSNTKDNKIESIQALRAFFFFGIFLFHASGYSDDLGFLAAICVSGFFVLSGFFVHLKNMDKDLEVSLKNCFTFVAKKISKLYILYLLCDFLMFLIGQVSNLCYAGVFNISFLDIKLFLLRALLLQSLVPSFDIAMSGNAVSWFLSTLSIIYFLYPFVLKLWKKVDKKLLFVLFSTFLWGLALFFITNFDDGLAYTLSYSFPLFRLLDFLWGMFLAENMNKISMFFNKHRVLHLIPLLFFAFVQNINCFNHLPMGIYNFIIWLFYATSITFLIPTTILLIQFYGKQDVVSKLLTNKVTVFIGDISNYTYLIHYVVVVYFEYLFGFLGVEISKYRTLVMVADFIITIFASWIWSRIVNRWDIKRDIINKEYE